MRRMRVLGSALGLLALGTGCATTTGGTSTTASGSRMQVTRLTREQQTAWRDSTYAQAIADQEGPGASIRAVFSNLAGSRRLRGVFNLDADAYVVIGHIDADGVLRIVFPLDPRSDDGFVKGNKTYQTHEFFAGFTAQYAMRARDAYYRGSGVARTDSYDAGLGYLFIIASWRPMRFDRFQTEGSWDSFELADADYMKDPRPAIYELASLLAGENREAYTVKFARYTSTQNLYGGNSLFASSYGMRYCAGYQTFGFPFNPFSGLGAMIMDPSIAYYGSGYGYGQTFTRRGTTYYYDQFSDCYRSAPAGLGYPRYGYGYRIAQGPDVGGSPTPKRAFDPEGHRTPFNPQNVGSRMAPGGRAVDAGGGTLPSPTYRQRGLITSDEPVLPGRREPRVGTNGRLAEQSRPSIQEMVNRRPATNTEQSRGGYSSRQSSGSNYSPPAERRAAAPRDYDTPRPASGGDRAAPYDRATPVSTSSSGASAPPPASAPPSSSGAGAGGSGAGAGRPPGGTP